MTSWRAGRMRVELAWPPSTGSRCQTIRGGGPWQTDLRRWSTGHPGDHAAARLARPVSRDRVTPLCCGRGGVTRSFSCRSADGQDGTGSSTGHTGHRPTAISMVRRRAELARPRLPGPVRHSLRMPEPSARTAGRRPCLLALGRFVGPTGQDGGCNRKEERRVVTAGKAGYWIYKAWCPSRAGSTWWRCGFCAGSCGNCTRRGPVAGLGPARPDRGELGACR